MTEAVYLIERMIDVLAQKLGIDKAEIRLRNFVRKEQFPHTTPLGLEYDSATTSRPCARYSKPLTMTACAQSRRSGAPILMLTG